MKEAYVPSDVDLAGAPGPFCYELDMFRTTTDALTNGSLGQCSTLIQNAVLESALIHCRNLVDFFTAVPLKDDVVAGHFVAGADGAPWRSESMPECLARRDEINKSLMHLTFTRSSQKPIWRWDFFRAEVEEAYAQFLILLPLGDRDAWRV